MGNRIHKKDAFTLAELLVGLIILGITSLVFMKLMNTTVRSQKSSEDYTQFLNIDIEIKKYLNDRRACSNMLSEFDLSPIPAVVDNSLDTGDDSYDFDQLYSASEASTPWLKVYDPSSDDFTEIAYSGWVLTDAKILQPFTVLQTKAEIPVDLADPASLIRGTTVMLYSQIEFEFTRRSDMNNSRNIASGVHVIKSPIFLEVNVDGASPEVGSIESCYSQR